MAENIKRRSIDAYSQFEDWLSDQPFWLQDAAYRIYHGLEIGEEQISSYADMCILQANKQKTEYKHLNPNESKKQEVSSCMTIQKLSGIDAKGTQEESWKPCSLRQRQQKSQ